MELQRRFSLAVVNSLWRILSGEREVDVALTCERETWWRRERVDKFAATFPQGAHRGTGARAPTYFAIRPTSTLPRRAGVLRRSDGAVLA